MSEKIVFTRNYSDLSTNQGFQFEFSCDRCGTGYRTRFKPSALGTVANVLDAAGSLLGGLFGQAADLGERVRSASWEKAHDEAFQETINEMKPEFAKCPHCSSWVCRESCWNTKKGLCKQCAPDLTVEMSAAQSSRSVEEVWAHAQMAEEDKKLAQGNWRDNIRASCPECEAPLAAKAKFCPECGAKMDKTKHCSECGAKLEPGVKFCSECGTKA